MPTQLRHGVAFCTVLVVVLGACARHDADVSAQSVTAQSPLVAVEHAQDSSFVWSHFVGARDDRPAPAAGGGGQGGSGGGAGGQGGGAGGAHPR